MPKPADLSRCLAPLDQDRTIIAVIEMSQSSFLQAYASPAGLITHAVQSTRSRGSRARQPACPIRRVLSGWRPRPGSIRRPFRGTRSGPGS